MHPIVDWAVPSCDGGSTEISVGAGEVVVIVGPNGSGKSSLNFWMSRMSGSAPVRRILAHRRVWLASAGPEITSSSRAQMESTLAYYDAQVDSRTKDQYGEHRSSKVLYDLLGRVNARNARVAAAATQRKLPDEIEVSLLDQISDLMELAGIGLRFGVGESMGFEAVKGSVAYPISEMSDGEKAAFQLAAEVLLAPEGGIQIIDEPERHLHRSISAPLVSALVKMRQDCAFVLFTHDLDIYERFDVATRKLFIVDSVRWESDNPVAWSLHQIAEETPHLDAARRAIMGGRKELLFVEGDTGSLDTRLYSLLFPTWTIVASGGADEVARSVKGLQDSNAFHWVKAAGIVDGDARTGPQTESARRHSLFTLGVNEVENLFYLSEVVDAQATKQAASLGESGPEMLSAAREAGLSSVRDAKVQQNLAADNALKVLRREVSEAIPTKAGLIAGGDTVRFELASTISEELEALQHAVAESNYEDIAQRYPIRDSGLPTAVAKALRYQRREDYESAVLVTLRESSELRSGLKRYIGDII